MAILSPRIITQGLESKLLIAAPRIEAYLGNTMSLGSLPLCPGPLLGWMNWEVATWEGLCWGVASRVLPGATDKKITQEARLWEGWELVGKRSTRGGIKRGIWQRLKVRAPCGQLPVLLAAEGLGLRGWASWAKGAFPGLAPETPRDWYFPFFPQW